MKSEHIKHKGKAFLVISGSKVVHSAATLSELDDFLSSEANWQHHQTEEMRQKWPYLARNTPEPYYVITADRYDVV